MVPFVIAKLRVKVGPVFRYCVAFASHFEPFVKLTLGRIIVWRLYAPEFLFLGSTGWLP
jgi:hypothetical protein